MVVRALLVGIVLAIAFTLYALVDAAMSDSTRARGVSKPAWVVIVAVLPVIGGLMWLFIGKGQRPLSAPLAADDDPQFTAQQLPDTEIDARMRDLEERLKELDAERFPGEDQDTPQ